MINSRKPRMSKETCCNKAYTTVFAKSGGDKRPPYIEGHNISDLQAKPQKWVHHSTPRLSIRDNCDVV
jgi:hypothetical protein